MLNSVSPSPTSSASSAGSDAPHERAHYPERAVTRGPPQRANLDVEQLGPSEAQPQAAQPKPAGTLIGRPTGGKRISNQPGTDLILVDVERPHRDRSRRHAL